MWHSNLCFLYFISVVYNSILSTAQSDFGDNGLNNNSTKKQIPSNRDFRFINVGLAMHKYKIIPDVIPIAPTIQIKTLYETGAKVYLGNILRPFKVKDEPKISWIGIDHHSFHTLAMVDPDGENQKRTVEKEWKHWLVINMPGNIITLGETISRYIGPGPLPHSGFHRYVLLVYKQPKRLILNEPKYNSDTEDRGNFSIANFAEKYQLGIPVAGNFFRSLYVNDNYESELFKEIKHTMPS